MWHMKFIRYQVCRVCHRSPVIPRSPARCLLQIPLIRQISGAPNPSSASTACPSRPVLLPPRHSRVREVEAACTALAESVQLGDEAWFERVVTQLRSVLLERLEEVAPQEVLAGKAGKAGKEQNGIEWPLDAGDARLPYTSVPAASDVTVGKEHDGIEGPLDGRDTQAPYTSVPAASDEPAWLQALRLLEAAALGNPPPGPAAVDSDTKKNVAASPFVEARLPTQPFAGNDNFETGLADYLSNFESSSATVSNQGFQSQKDAEQMEPSWARALRLLAAASTEQTDSKEASDEEQPSWARALWLLEAAGLEGPSTPSAPNFEHDSAPKVHEFQDNAFSHPASSDDGLPAGDDKHSLRMSRYAELMQEADRISQVAPGASVPPLRFGELSKQDSPRSQPHKTVPPPPPQAKVSEELTKKKARKRVVDDPMVQAKGKGNLIPALPGPSDDEVRDDAVLRKEDFHWSEHEFNDGERTNKRVLRGFRREFKKMCEETPEGLRNPRLLTAALDLALACVKCYELDKADAIYCRVIGECRRRGMPWDVKCIQDMATLRCKQHRQADAAELLEELANKAPPHPATFINLGTVYNQLRQYDRAESWFRQAVNLKGGEPGREDLWNLGIVRKNQQRYDEALPMLEQALAEFQEHEPEHPVTIAKLHSTVGGCLHDMGRTADAVEQYKVARELYIATVGTMSPLFCSAAEGLAKASKAERQYEQSFDALVEAFAVHAKGDAVHPTPLFEQLELALELHGHQSSLPLDRMAPLLDAAVANLEARGLAEDGNAGLVMSRGAKLLSRIGADPALRGRAETLLSRGAVLIRRSHEEGEADLSHEIVEADMLLQSIRSPAISQ